MGGWRVHLQAARLQLHNLAAALVAHAAGLCSSVVPCCLVKSPEQAAKGQVEWSRETPRGAWPRHKSV